MKPGTVKWGHSRWSSPDDGWSMSFDSREACIEDGKREYKGPFWIASGTAPKPSQFVNVDRMLEEMGEAACDEFGAEDFPDLSHEKQRELVKLIEDLLDAHVDMTFVVMNDDAEEISP